MAKPIKNTPDLKGKDAEIFLKKIEKKKHEIISTEKMNAIFQSAKKFQRLIN